LEHGFDVSNDTGDALTRLLMRQALRSERRSVDRYRGDFASDPAPSATTVAHPLTRAEHRPCLQETFEQYLGDKRKLHS
jgi:hypothetical protein